MGCSSPQNAALPNIPQNHLNRFMQLSQISHALNVNRKYEHLAKIQTGKEVGKGYRKTYAYYALTTKQDIQAKRKQFWQTRTSGQPAIWQIIRQSILVKDQNVGEEMLRSNKIYLLNGSIQLCLDARYNKYQVPVFCINEPLSYSAHREEKNLHLEYEDTTLEVTIRSAKFPNDDIKLSQRSSADIAVVKQTIRAMKQISPELKIRFFYSGREMKDDKTLGNYGYIPGTVIQAMIM